MAKKTKRRKAKEPYVPSVPVDIWGLGEGHHMGLRTGFDKSEGHVYPAPSYVQPMDELRNEREALQAFIDAMQMHIHRQFQTITKREDAWWKRVEEDLGIRRGEAVYHYDSRRFQRKKEEPTT